MTAISEEEKKEITDKANLFDRTINREEDKATTDAISERIRRRIISRKGDRGNPYESMSVMGMVGWSLAVPLIVGTLVGGWLDSKFPSERSWTLSFMAMGLALGAYNAFYCVKKEAKIEFTDEWIEQITGLKNEEKKLKKDNKEESDKRDS
jgi:ATP synthase protein I